MALKTQGEGISLFEGGKSCSDPTGENYQVLGIHKAMSEAQFDIIKSLNDMYEVSIFTIYNLFNLDSISLIGSNLGFEYQPE